MNDSMDLEERILELLAKFNATRDMYLIPLEECEEFLGENYTKILEEEEGLKNVSCLKHAPTMSSSALVKGFVLIIMAVLSLIGNVATLHNIKTTKKRSVGHIYNLLFQLSVADLCVTLWCMLGDAIWYLTVEWKLGNVECKIFKYAQMFSLYLSTFIMVIIGVDRFIAIKYPMNSITSEFCSKLIILCWILSATLSTPQVIVFKVLEGPFLEPFRQCVTYGSYSYEWQEKLYTLFTVAFTLIIPLTIIATTYLLTVCVLHHNEDVIGNSNGIHAVMNPNRRRLMRRAKIKSLRISFVIVAAFIICWTPYYISMIYTFINRKDEQEPENPDNILFTACFFFGVSNSLCNPIIYGVFHMKPKSNQFQSGNAKSQRTLFMQIRYNPETTDLNSADQGMLITTSPARTADMIYRRKKSTESVRIHQILKCPALLENSEEMSEV